ncbi:MAG: hypothetical protein AAB521_00870, partial [Patescibacteria group bacterium]
MSIKNLSIQKYLLLFKTKLIIVLATIIVILLGATSLYLLNSQTVKIDDLNNKNTNLEIKLKSVNSELIKLKNEDQFKINEGLKKDIKNTETAYKESLGIYNRITDLRAQSIKTADLDKQFAKVLNELSKLNYSSASSDLKTLTADVAKQEQTLQASSGSVGAQTQAQIANVSVNNSAPSSGFSQQ